MSKGKFFTHFWGFKVPISQEAWQEAEDARLRRFQEIHVNHRVTTWNEEGRLIVEVDDVGFRCDPSWTRDDAIAFTHHQLRLHACENNIPPCECEGSGEMLINWHGESMRRMRWDQATRVYEEVR